MVKLLQDNFEVLSTRMHLARLALITDNIAEASRQTQQVWETRREAKNYVLARILWFKLCLEYLNTKAVNKSVFSKMFSEKTTDGQSLLLRGQLKTVLQKDDAFMEWTMQPVLDHLKPGLTEHQLAFLTALVAAMSDKANLEKLNEFEEWKDIRADEIK